MSCNFLPNIPDLQPITVARGQQVVFRSHARPSRCLSSGVWSCDGSTRYELNAKCQDFISRYLGRSLISPDNADVAQVNLRLLGLAFEVSLHLDHLIAWRDFGVDPQKHQPS